MAVTVELDALRFGREGLGSDDALRRLTGQEFVNQKCLLGQLLGRCHQRQRHKVWIFIPEAKDC